MRVPAAPAGLDHKTMQAEQTSPSADALIDPAQATERISFRPLAMTDLPMLHTWLSQAHWTEWWGEAPTLDEVNAEYGAWISDCSQVQPYIALLDGQPFGY